MPKLTNTFSEIDSSLQYTNKNLSENRAFTAIRSAATRRVDVVMLGDSNQRFNGYGFAKGLDKALTDEYGQYATPLFFDNGVGGYASTAAQIPNWSDSVPSEQQALFPVAKTRLTDANENTGVLLVDGESFDFSTANLRGWMAYGGFPTGVGEMRMRARLEESPFSTIVTGASIPTNTGEYDLNIASLDVGSLAAGLPFIKIGMSGNVAITQPATYFYYRVENINASSGISTHTLYAGGGQSLYDYAAFVKGLTLEQLKNYFAETRRLQLAKGQRPQVVVYINSGVNDRNETSSPTQGEYGFGSSSSDEGYIDNLLAITNRIRETWNHAGWDLSELSFMFVASHVVSDPFNSQLTSYRSTLESMAAENDWFSVINLEINMTYDEAVANNWYQDPITETVHLTENGYNAVANKMLDIIKANR